MRSWRWEYEDLSSSDAGLCGLQSPLCHWICEMPCFNLYQFRGWYLANTEFGDTEAGEEGRGGEGSAGATWRVLDPDSGQWGRQL